MCYDNEIGDNMNKIEILNKLKELELDKEKYIIISGASLVLQDIIEETSDIDLSCSDNYYKEIKWDTKMGHLDKEIKYYDVFEISNNLYDEKNIVEFDGYRLMNLEACLELKKKCNKSKDKKTIEKLDLYLCSLDNKRYEKELYKKNIKYIGGVDEVGRGPLVGPVVAACCVLDKNFELEGLTDSKKLSEKKRDIFYDYLIHNCVAYGIGVVSPERIDEINIYEASREAMMMAIKEVQKQIPLEHVLSDAMPLTLDVPNTPIIKGDFKSISIAAASVIAKVTRDRMMYELDELHPEYGFKDHKGYPTKKHIEAINKYGLIDGYRKTYGPVKEVLEMKK